MKFHRATNLSASPGQPAAAEARGEGGGACANEPPLCSNRMHGKCTIKDGSGNGTQFSSWRGRERVEGGYKLLRCCRAIRYPRTGKAKPSRAEPCRASGQSHRIRSGAKRRSHLCPLSPITTRNQNEHGPRGYCGP